MAFFGPSRPYRHNGHPMFIRESYQGQYRRQARLTNITHLGEDPRGGRFHPYYPNQVFSRQHCKPIARWLAVGLCNLADATARRVVAATTMKTASNNSDTTVDEQRFEQRILSKPHGGDDE